MRVRVFVCDWSVTGSHSVGWLWGGLCGVLSGAVCVLVSGLTVCASISGVILCLCDYGIYITSFWRRGLCILVCLGMYVSL